MKKNKVILSFSIIDFNDITHEEISSLVGVNPIRSILKGEKRNPKNPHSPLQKQHVWIMGSPSDQYIGFEDQMNLMLDIIENKMEAFKLICSKYYCEFSCAVFMYVGNGESTPWIHLDSRYHKLTKELNIEFDFDLYAYNA